MNFFKHVPFSKILNCGYLFFLILLLPVIFYTKIIEAQTIAQDSLALISLYHSTNGENWRNKDNWLTDQPLSSWYGVTISDGFDEPDNCVTQLNLRSNNLTGQISAKFCNLSKLKSLVLIGNKISGSIPPEFGNLSNLEGVWLQLNQITSIPPEFGNLSKLEILNLGDNNITTLPLEFWNLTNLEYLYFYDNQLSGPIPHEVGNILKLRNICFNRNQITGEIPSELGNLPYLYVLDLSENMITGTIPPELGNLNNLYTLSFSNNQITGYIPSTLGYLSNLRKFDLSNNQLIGTIPSEFENLSRLKTLNLSHNRLSSIPLELGNLLIIEELILNHNELSYIPPELKNLTNLTILNISDNQLTTIPSELGCLTNLHNLDIGHNEFTIIPPELGNLLNLETMNISYNQLTLIPPEVGNLSNLQEMDLSENKLTYIPTEMKNLLNLSILNIGSNQLTSIPSELVNLSNLQELYLNNNKLNDIPDFTSLTNLDLFNINNNEFTFEDIEPYVGLVNNFYYSPQDSVGVEQDTTLIMGLSYTISVSVGGTANKYQWIKDWFAIPDAIDSSFTLDSITISDAGGYNCMITNSIATKLTLYSRPVTISFPQQDSVALVAFYNRTNGNNWTKKDNWLSEHPISTWYGVKVSEERVVELNLNNNHLSGSLINELGLLTKLQILKLTDNQIIGSIPYSLGKLTNLKVLDLSKNLLTDRVPYFFVFLIDLQDLILNANYLTNLPNLSPLKNLNTLCIQDNMFYFWDIEQNIDVASNFTYSPQDSVGCRKYITLRAGSNYTFRSYIDGSANQYQWHKDGIPIPGADNRSYVLNSVDTLDSGVYTYVVTNNIANELTLYSRSMRLKVLIPDKIILHQNYPNPFNQHTIIKYEISKEDDVTLEIFDMKGRKVATIVNERQKARWYEVNWNAQNDNGIPLSSGIYLYRIKVGYFKSVKKMIYIK